MAQREMAGSAIDAIERRLGALLQRAVEVRKREEANHRARHYLDQLQDAIEELSTATEELRAQNEELASLRHEVARERRRYLDVFELAPDAYLVTDILGTIAEANHAAGALLGVSPDRLEGKRFAAFVPKPARSELRTWLASVQHSGPDGDASDRTRELSVQPRSGPPVPVEVRLAPLRTPTGAAASLHWLIRDVTARRRTEAALGQLSARLEGAREQERKTIAREIHDELGQALTALRMDLSWLEARLPKAAPNLTAKADEMGALVEKTIRAVRRIATGLRPPILDDLGLVAALEWQAEDLADRTGLRMNLDLDNVDMDEGRAAAVFRIFQEALTNIARHADARRVQVTLTATPRHVVLQVQDDGRGIDQAVSTDQPSLGLLGMRERAMAWAGTLDVQTQPGEGTTIILRMPLAGVVGE